MITDVHHYLSILVSFIYIFTWGIACKLIQYFRRPLPVPVPLPYIRPFVVCLFSPLGIDIIITAQITLIHIKASIRTYSWNINLLWLYKRNFHCVKLMWIDWWKWRKLLPEYTLNSLSWNSPVLGLRSQLRSHLCRGASGFVTGCPCGVWCRGFST